MRGSKRPCPDFALASFCRYRNYTALFARLFDRFRVIVATRPVRGLCVGCAAVRTVFVFRTTAADAYAVNRATRISVTCGNRGCRPFVVGERLTTVRAPARCLSPSLTDRFELFTKATERRLRRVGRVECSVVVSPPSR